MPQYFFDTFGPDGDCPDEEGITLPDLDSARRYARRALCEIAAERCGISDPVCFVVRVRDPTGAELYRASVALTEPASHEADARPAGQARPTPDDHTHRGRP